MEDHSTAGHDGGGVERRSRRDLLKKTAIGAAAAGVVWTAPRIEGLSLRPDYAAAQTPAASNFDIAVAGGGHAPVSLSQAAVSPAPSLNVGLAVFNLTSFDASQSATWAGLIIGPAAGVNCNIIGLDGSHTWGDLPSPTPAWDQPPNINSNPGTSQFASRQATGGTVSNSGSTTFTMHVTCT